MKKENTSPTLEQWSKLYEVAVNIKKLAPWNNLWDTDLFTIMIPGQKEPIFVSVMGRIGQCYGIGVYPGYRSIEGLNRLLEDSPADSNMNPLSFQNCLMCYYGNRDELAPKEREIIKSLSLKFRGENNWIYFRSMEEGFYPWFINSEQADLMIQALQNFVMAYTNYCTGEIKVDFEGRQTLAREYSKQHDRWLNAAIPMPTIPEMTVESVLKNELILQKLKNARKNKFSIELDIIYLPSPVQDKKDDRPYFPSIALLVDRKNGIVINQKMFDASIKNEKIAIEMLAEYIDEYGKPEKLFVRDKYFHRYVDSFCTQIGITAVHSKGMACTDEFTEQLMEFMGEE